MKKVLSIIIAAILTMALCISAVAVKSLDRLVVNVNTLTPDDETNLRNASEIRIEKGDKLYILGWALNRDTSSTLKEVVYTLDGVEYKCADNYRDRTEVAAAIGVDASLGTHAGIGRDDGAFELTGIDRLSDGAYKMAIIAKYEDGTEEDLKSEFTLIVGDGEIGGGEDPGIPENYIEIELTAETSNGVDVEEVDGKLICTTVAAGDPWVSIPLDVDTSVYNYFSVTYRATKEIGANNTYLKVGGYIGSPDGGDWEPHGMDGTADGELHTALYSIKDGFPTFAGEPITGIRLTCCGEEGGVFTIESIKFYGEGEEKEPEDIWLCNPDGLPATGWWMNPFTDNEWNLAVRFETPKAFDGFNAFAFANPAGATVIIRLYDDYGNVLEELERTQYGDGELPVEFSKGYEAGNYVIEFSSTDNGEWFVLGSGDYGDVWAEIYGNCNINGDTLSAPYMYLTEYTGNDPYVPDSYVTEIDPVMLYELFIDSNNRNTIDAQLNGDFNEEYCTIYALGDDPFFMFANPLNVGENNKIAVIKYRSNDAGFLTMDFYLKIAEPHAQSDKVVTDGNWNYAIIDLSDGFGEPNPLWDGTIARFDPMSGQVDGTSVDIALIKFFDSVEAFEEWQNEEDSAKLNITVDGAVEPVEYNIIGGDTVEVKINLTNNNGVSSLRAVVDWSEKLTLIKAEYNIYNENDKSAMINEPEDWESVTSPFVFNWLTARGVAEGDCTYVTLTFKVSEEAEAGEFLPVNIEVSPIDLFVDLDTRVPFTSANGGVTVVSFYPGDIDDDGIICNKDVVALFRYVNNAIEPELVNERATDVNGDGEVNNKDVVALFKMVSAADDIVVPR